MGSTWHVLEVRLLLSMLSAHVSFGRTKGQKLRATQAEQGGVCHAADPHGRRVYRPGLYRVRVRKCRHDERSEQPAMIDIQQKCDPVKTYRLHARTRTATSKPYHIIRTHGMLGKHPRPFSQREATGWQKF